ncbi:4F2 cell-surface antigen heavy chain-like [Trichosurus vulpecula]|uniref:4F2 cell-surface antigen heavy chain-like n=1 Tax=Trichosurus vulpecula TaxID=9337 RepID=UPI00186B53A9|nr:4F2 cell-surface antigen heavy chain-like [Trichosurus vulpecula]
MEAKQVTGETKALAVHIATSQDAEVDVAEVDMKDMALNEMEPLSVASGGKKKGVVNVKVADYEADAVGAAAASKFTGLSKEELLKVARSPAWVCTHRGLLLLFCLGCLGMLARVVVIIMQAPRCHELQVQRWWHQGALYRIGDLKAFQAQPSNAIGSLSGVKAHLDYLSNLKVKALVLGPIHKNLEDNLAKTDLLQIDPTIGSQEEFIQLLEAAKKKNIQIILDLTPNYQSESSWFLKKESEEVNEKMKEALSFWLKVGVNGIQVHDVQKLSDAASFLSLWNNLIHSINDDRVLIARTAASDLLEILSLLNNTDLLSSSYLEDFERRSSSGKELKELVANYLSAASGHWCSWTYSQVGHLDSYVPSHLLCLYYLLLFTLPGTPIFSYGDEIGLQVATLPGQPAEAPIMLWDEKALGPSEFVNLNMTVQGQTKDPASLLALFCKLSDSRGKEQSLLHGDFVVLPTQDDLFAYVRYWDRNDRFIIVLNLGSTSHEAELRMPSMSGSQKLELPEMAALVISTQGGHQEGSMLSLQKLAVAPGEGLLLKFPYMA